MPTDTRLPSTVPPSAAMATPNPRRPNETFTPAKPPRRHRRIQPTSKTSARPFHRISHRANPRNRQPFVLRLPHRSTTSRSSRSKQTSDDRRKSRGIIPQDFSPASPRNHPTFALKDASHLQFSLRNHTNHHGTAITVTPPPSRFTPTSSNYPRHRFHAPALRYHLPSNYSASAP